MSTAVTTTQVIDLPPGLTPEELEVYVLDLLRADEELIFITVAERESRAAILDLGRAGLL